MDSTSHSGGNLKWIKSSRCNLGKNCVELSRDATTVAIRDSKGGAANFLRLGPAAWTSFLASCQSAY